MKINAAAILLALGATAYAAPAAEASSMNLEERTVGSAKFCQKFCQKDFDFKWFDPCKFCPQKPPTKPPVDPKPPTKPPVDPKPPTKPPVDPKPPTKPPVDPKPPTKPPVDPKPPKHEPPKHQPPKHEPPKHPH